MADEYIKREVVLNAITVDGFEHFSGCLSSTERSLINMMRDTVSEIPSADVAPVVRCRECAKYIPDTGWCGEHSCFTDAAGAFCHPWESVEWKMFDPDYFCADGVRKEGDTNA